MNWTNLEVARCKTREELLSLNLIKETEYTRSFIEGNKSVGFPKIMNQIFGATIVFEKEITHSESGIPCKVIRLIDFKPLLNGLIVPISALDLNIDL